MADSMERIETPDGGTSALVSRRGAGIHGLRIEGREVMPADTEDAQRRWYSGFTLAPWPNRLRDGGWVFDGQTLSAPVNDGKGNALHGLVVHRLFDVTDRSRNSISFECSLGDDEVYPFAVTVFVTYTVDGRGLHCRFGGRNDSAKRVPFAIGTHPFIPFDDDSTITLSAERAFEVDERLLPTGRLVDLAQWSAEPGVPIAMADFVADDCFTDLRRDGGGLAHTTVGYADGATTDLWQDAALNHTVIFTTRDFRWLEGGTKAVAIEPQTVPTNAFNSGTDLAWLAPGEALGATWGISATGPKE